jgi:hypothetical protein
MITELKLTEISSVTGGGKISKAFKATIRWLKKNNVKIPLPPFDF